MNRNVIVVFAIVVVGFVAAMSISQRHFNTVDALNDQQLDAARIRNEYMERVGWIRANPDEKAYKDEVKSFFRWYFTEVDGHLKKFNLNTNFDDYLKMLDQRAGKDVVKEGPAAKSDSDEQLKSAFDKKSNRITELRSGYALTKTLFDTFRSGRYEPVWSGSDKGMRLDVVSTDVAMVDSKPKIRFLLALWGAQREAVESDARGPKHIRTSLEMSTSWKLFDDKGKLYGEMNAGNPAMRNDLPEVMIAQFPPQIVLGYYDLDKVPANVKQMEVSFNATSHAPSGGEVMANFLWKLSPPDAWKLGAGEAWEGATTSIRSKDEIDPAAAAKAAKKK